MVQFFVLKKNIYGNRVKIVGQEARHLARVLRKKVGKKIQILIGENTQENIKQSNSVNVPDETCSYFAEIEEIGKDKVEAKILTAIPVNVPRVKVHLFVAILKQAKMDYLIQKVTELGVEEITPLVTNNTVVRLDSSTSKHKVERWQKIILNAVKQCGRAKLPLINLPLECSDALKKIDNSLAGQAVLNLIFWEKEKGNNFKKIISKLDLWPEKVNLFVGPEGGFVDEEINLAQKYNFITVSLGNNILRSETAAIVTTGIVLYEFGALG